MTLTPEPDVPTILDAVQRRGDWGIIAWENNVEGYVVPNLDALIDADNVVGFARVGVNVSFDAFTLPGHITRRLPYRHRPSARVGAMPPFHGRPSAAAAAVIVEWCRLPRP